MVEVQNSEVNALALLNNGLRLESFVWSYRNQLDLFLWLHHLPALTLWHQKQIFVTVFTQACHQSISWSNWIHSTSPPPANLPKIHSDPIVLLMPPSSGWSLSHGLSHQNLVHRTPSVYALPLMLETKFHTHTKALAEIWFLCILTCTFLDRRQEDKRLWTKW
jgi:hypothetical protein